jgi:beta-N-acetylhexosaminidase
MEEMRSHGVITCGKHFPGHGGTLVDSHKALPVDDRTAESIRERDLVPFARAANLKADMIMTAHVLYPFLDPERPATLSPTLIDGLLRKIMGFDGVVISDDLDMGAVAKSYTPAESTFLALKAGVDIPLICNSPEKVFAARQRIVDAVQSNELSEARIRQSLDRIGRLKASYASSMRLAALSDVRAYFHV